MARRDWKAHRVESPGRTGGASSPEGRNCGGKYEKGKSPAVGDNRRPEGGWRVQQFGGYDTDEERVGIKLRSTPTEQPEGLTADRYEGCVDGKKG